MLLHIDRSIGDENAWSFTLYTFICATSGMAEGFLGTHFPTEMLILLVDWLEVDSIGFS